MGHERQYSGGDLTCKRFTPCRIMTRSVYRYPSLSEMRLNTSAALAFNCKWLIGFEYNAGATTLFDILPNGYSGDTYTNTNYIEQIDINLRAQNLGRSLVCLKPIYDLHNPNDTNNPPPGPASVNPSFPDGTTTSIMILKGNPGSTTNTGEPIGFQDNPATPKSYSWWESQKNDPYLAGWAVTNMGVNNGGVAGQVFISVVHADRRAVGRDELHQRDLFPGGQRTDRADGFGDGLPAGRAFEFPEQVYQRCNAGSRNGVAAHQRGDYWRIPGGSLIFI